MTNYHICLSRSINLEAIALAAQAGQCPRHIMSAIQAKLSANIHHPGTDSPSILDKIAAKIAGRPEHWTLARSLSEKLGKDDLIYCAGEDIGIPIAVLCGAKKERPKIVVFFHNIDRPRGKLALKLFNLAHRIDRFIACSQHQTEFLKNYLNLAPDQVWLLPEQTDTKFFTPGLSTPTKTRPVIASVGLEKRDYRLLAAATKDLDIDVKISGFSQDAQAIKQAFPEIMPDNMSRRFYEWSEVVQLYRDADIVVVSMIDNKYGAGVTVLLEAMACQRPVIVTKTTGLKNYLTTTDIVIAIEPGDVVGLRKAIEYLLQNPQIAQAQAERGYQYVLHHHNSEDYVDNFVKLLTAI